MCPACLVCPTICKVLFVPPRDKSGTMLGQVIVANAMFSLTVPLLSRLSRCVLNFFRGHTACGKVKRDKQESYIGSRRPTVENAGGSVSKRAIFVPLLSRVSRLSRGFSKFFAGGTDESDPLDHARLIGVDCQRAMAAIGTAVQVIVPAV